MGFIGWRCECGEWNRVPTKTPREEAPCRKCGIVPPDDGLGDEQELAIEWATALAGASDRPRADYRDRYRIARALTPRQRRLRRLSALVAARRRNASWLYTSGICR